MAVTGASLPISFVACEARGAVEHTFSPVDDKVSVPGQVNLRAQFHSDATPALKLISAWGTVWHTATLVLVMDAGGAGHVVVGFSAAAKALAVATHPFVCTGKLAVFWAYWRRWRKRPVCYNKFKNDKGQNKKRNNAYKPQIIF